MRSFPSAFVCALCLCEVVVLRAQPMARGADVGWLSEMEAAGRSFYDASGVQRDLLDILQRDYCMNSIRLRVWVNPAEGWSGKADVVRLAKRARAKNMRLMIDFHYSDNWADPGKQFKPAAWESFSTARLTQAVYEHTYEILDTLRREGVAPEWVQVGNETNDGMLWPDGRASAGAAQMHNYAQFVLSGHNAVKAVFPQAITLVHVANGYDNDLFRWNIGGLVSNGAQFDAVAMSLYPTQNDYDSLATRTLANMNDMVSRYNKSVMISEIGLPVAYPSQSKAFVETMIAHTLQVSGGRGLGVFWWEPQAYNWRGYDKVAWNTHGRPTLAMEGFNSQCLTFPFSSSQPPPLSSSSMSVCLPLAVTPFVQIDQEPWAESSHADVQEGQTVRWGPHPMAGGTWSWTGPNGFTASTREVSLSSVQLDQRGHYTAVYTSSPGCSASQVFALEVREVAVPVTPAQRSPFLFTPKSPLYDLQGRRLDTSIRVFRH